MNILHSVFADGWGGLEKYPLTLNDELIKNCNNLIIVTIDGTNLHKECLTRGLKVYTIQKFKKISIKIIKKLSQIIKNEKIDVVHMNTSREIYNWYFALFNKKVKLFITFHIGVPNHNEFLHRILYQKVDKLIAITKSEKNQLSVNMPVELEKIDYIHNGVDLGKFKKVDKNFLSKEKFNIKNKKMIVVAANLSKGKGVFDLIDALTFLKHRREEFKILWAGTDTHIDEPYTMVDLINKTKELKIDDMLKFIGYCNNLPELLNDADGFLLPSHKESFGIVFIEAMSKGLPVIGCDAGGVPELINDDVNGFLAKPNNPESLAEQIEKFLDLDKDQWINISEKNLEHVKQFDMKSHVEKLLKIYRGQI